MLQSFLFDCICHATGFFCMSPTISIVISYHITLHHFEDSSQFRPTFSDTLIMSPSIKCHRCLTKGLMCVIDTTSSSGVKSLCRECRFACVDHCVYPPSIRFVLSITNKACTHCREHHQKCIFRNMEDEQCIRCNKRHLSCMFKLNGK